MYQELKYSSRGNYFTLRGQKLVLKKIKDKMHWGFLWFVLFFKHYSSSYLLLVMKEMKMVEEDHFFYSLSEVKLRKVQILKPFFRSGKRQESSKLP